MRGKEGYPLLLVSKQMLSEKGYSPPTGVVEIDANEGILSKQRRKEIDGMALLLASLKQIWTRGQEGYPLLRLLKWTWMRGTGYPLLLASLKQMWEGRQGRCPLLLVPLKQMQIKKIPLLLWFLKGTQMKGGRRDISPPAGAIEIDTNKRAGKYPPCWGCWNGHEWGTQEYPALKQVGTGGGTFCWMSENKNKRNLVGIPRVPTPLLLFLPFHPSYCGCGCSGLVAWCSAGMETQCMGLASFVQQGGFPLPCQVIDSHVCKSCICSQLLVW